MKKFSLSVHTKFTLLQSFIILFFVISGVFQVNSLFRLRDINTLHTGYIKLSQDFRDNEAATRDLFRLQEITQGLDDKGARLKHLVSRADELAANMRPALGKSQRGLISGEVSELSKSFHEYAVIFDELANKVKSLQGDNRDETTRLLDLSVSLAGFASSSKNEYFSFLLRDIADIGRKYSITPGINLLKQLNARLEEAGKIISSNENASVLPGNESSRNELFSKLSDTRALANSLEESGNRLDAAGEGAMAKLDRVSKSITQSLGLLETDVEGLYAGYFFRTVAMQLFALLIIALLIIVFVWRFSALQNYSLFRIGEVFRQLAAGKLPDNTDLGSEIEFSTMSSDMGKFIDDLQHKANFAAQIGQGNFETSYTPPGEDDILGNSLIEMQSSLHKARQEQEAHHVEEEKRRWINEGLARFADVMRTANNDLNELANQIIQNLVRYMKANQGGLFLINEGDQGEPLLELTASFAYDRKKYLKKAVRMGEGVLGTCAMEKETIMLTEIPEDYIEVTSGLGEAPPNCLILIPLKLENELLGVVEIASFSIYQAHEVDFLEKIAASIASTISSVRINTRTSKLLVQSQQQAQELAEKEEEMRQSMEELQATQEESSRREMEIAGILNAINNSSIVIEFNTEGVIIDTNQKFLDLLNTRREAVIGRKYGELVITGSVTEAQGQLWTALREGAYQSKIENLKSMDGKDIWLSINFTPLIDRSQKPYKILSIASDITESKKQEISLKKQAGEILRKNNELESLTESVDASLIKCVFDPAGYLVDSNENYEKTTGFGKKELIGKDARSFLKPDEFEQFEKIWTEVMKGKLYTGVIKRTKPTGEELWLMSNFTPVKDEKGTIFKVYFLAQDITEKKLKYKLLEEANREIERLKKQVKE